MNIILMGYRGSGKTSIGKRVASQTWKTFVDTDEEIRQRFDNKPIRQIWEDEGEDEFRKVEGEVVVELVQQTDMVIALGGGSLTVASAREAVVNANDTKRIYLACKPAELAKRIAGDTTSMENRPSLTGQGGGIEEIEAVLAERDPVYREVADAVFDVTYIDINGAASYLTSNYL